MNLREAIVTVGEQVILEAKRAPNRNHWHVKCLATPGSVINNNDCLTVIRDLFVLCADDDIIRVDMNIANFDERCRTYTFDYADGGQVINVRCPDRRRWLSFYKRKNGKLVEYVSTAQVRKARARINRRSRTGAARERKRLGYWISDRLN
jgi:hypothetical protein